MLAKILLETNNKEVMDPIFFCFSFLLFLNKFLDQRTFPVLESKFKIKPSFETKMKKFSDIAGLATKNAKPDTTVCSGTDNDGTILTC